MKIYNDIDYVEFYARRLKEDNRLFKKQKEFLESQLKSSCSLFQKMFTGKDFKKKARKYLRSVGLLTQ